MTTASLNSTAVFHDNSMGVTAGLLLSADPACVPGNACLQLFFKKGKKRKAHQHVRTFHPKPHPLCFQGTPNPSCNLCFGKLPETSAFYPMPYLELYLELILPNNLLVLLFIPWVNLISDIFCTFSVFLFIYFFSFYFTLLTSMSVHHMHAWYPLKLKRVWDPMELE